MKNIHILAFTHRQLEVSQIGRLHIAPDSQKEKLNQLKDAMELEELLFISTCNRVEFVFNTDEEVDETFIVRFLRSLYPDFNKKALHLFASSYEYYLEINAVKHLLKVAASVDSMIVGEREIITQVRKSFNDCRSFGLTGDSIRLLIRFTIESAKRIYTETNIASNPVSVVSLAYHILKSKAIQLDARVLVIGAGVTNSNMLRFLKKHGFKHFVVFNRTVEKAKKMAEMVDGTAFPLSELPNYKKGFDVMITCTGSDEPIVSVPIYENLLQGETTQKTIIDLAIPHDLAPEINQKYAVDHVSIDFLQELSRKNLKERTRELIHVDQIIAESVLKFRALNREREVEVAMKEVPHKIKSIKQTALQHVFAKDVEELDKESKATLEKVIDFMEKKYISIPMKMAKKIMLEK